LEILRLDAFDVSGPKRLIFARLKSYSAAENVGV
jgi:hypothetical protein